MGAGIVIGTGKGIKIIIGLLHMEQEDFMEEWT